MIASILHLTLFLAILVCLSNSQPLHVDSKCTSEIGTGAPVFEEKEIVNQFIPSTFEMDITEIHLWYGSQVHYNFGRLFFDSHKWFFKNNSKTFELPSLDTGNVSFIKEIRIKERHVHFFCDPSPSNSDNFIYLFSIKGKLESSLISDVRIESISENGIENKEVLSYLTVFRKLNEAIRKTAPK